MASALLPSASGLAVGRARFSGPGASRLLLEQALGEVAVDRLGLRAEEVLYVPRLAGPTRLRAGATRHFAGGLGLVLREIADRADRDPVGGSATDRPCRFSSRAAFAAWLIAAILDKGSVEAATVMRAATGCSTAQGWWRSEVLSQGRTLVPVLVRLAAAGTAARWLSRLDAVELELAIASLSRDYGLALASAPIADREADPRPARLRAGLAAEWRDAHPVRHARVADNEILAAHRAVAIRDEAFTELPVAAQRLVVAAVLLARSPGIPRDTLARAIERGIGQGLPSPSAPVMVATAVQTDSIQTAAPPRAATTAARAGPSVGPARKPTIIPHTANHAVVPTIVAPRAPASRTGSSSAEAKARVDLSATEVIARLVPSSGPEAARGPTAETPREQGPDALVEPRSVVDTAFGGVAFLVNAFLAMGLYPDFTRPLDPGLPLSPLALADRLGVHWFGARYRRDPLHRWIARRGMRGSLPRRWRVEREWLRPFAGEGAWQGGSTLWHAAGFPLANRSAAVAARRLARRLGVPPVRGRRGRSTHGAGHDPDWLECLALFLAARLCRAAPDDALTPAMLEIPARAIVSEARLDFHFTLAALPIALRLAGLDRDPGWLPTEGRDLRFHFE